MWELSVEPVRLAVDLGAAVIQQTGLLRLLPEHWKAERQKTLAALPAAPTPGAYSVTGWADEPLYPTQPLAGSRVDSISCKAANLLGGNSDQSTQIDCCRCRSSVRPTGCAISSAMYAL